MYVRDTNVIVIRPGHRGSDHASERFELGGAPENDLLPQGDEITLYRIVVSQPLPDTVMLALAGQPVRAFIEVPPFKGFSALHGSDLGGDVLNRIRDCRIMYARAVERGVLVAVENAPEPDPKVPDGWPEQREKK